MSINHNTLVEYNAADIANGGVHNKKLYPLSGELKDNIIGDVRTELMDPDNMDFRPQPESAYIQNNVGPYSPSSERSLWRRANARNVSFFTLYGTWIKFSNCLSGHSTAPRG